MNFTCTKKLLFLIALVAPSALYAQMAPRRSVESIEARAINSETIVVGTISNFHRGEARTYGMRRVEFKVSETIRAHSADGKPLQRFEVDGNYPVAQLEEWQANSVRLLVTVAKGGHDWTSAGITDLDSDKFQAFSSDFKVVRDPERVLSITREQVRKSASSQIRPTHLLTPPNSKVGKQWLSNLGPDNNWYAGLVVPVDANLERKAFEFLRSSDEETRLSGLSALRFFKSSRNIGFVKSLLRDFQYQVNVAGEDNNGVEVRTFRIRSLAYGILTSWNVTVPAPEVNESISKLGSLSKLTWRGKLVKEDLLRMQTSKKLQNLDLSQAEFDPELLPLVGQLKGLTHLKLPATAATDAGLIHLVGLTNLRALTLDRNAISDQGLTVFKDWKGLRELSLAETDVTDVGLTVLRTARPGFRVMPVHATSRVSNSLLVPMSKARCDRQVYELNSSQIANWSSQTIGRFFGPIQESKSPTGRTYLGPFGQQALRLKLDSLPAHKNVRVELELFVIGSWDGDGTLGAGPDIFNIQVPGVGTLLHSTFFNNTEGAAGDLTIQSYPEAYPIGRHLGFTGASEIRSLGFEEPWDGRWNKRDAVYQLEFTFAHSGAGLELVFTGQTVPQDVVQQLTHEENWGIARMKIKTD